MRSLVFFIVRKSFVHCIKESRQQNMANNASLSSAFSGLKDKKGLLLINIGTPAAPTVTAVKSYLREFLNDPYVIGMPDLLRSFLVNGIIVPFRAKKSAKRYQKLWTSEGAPLLVHLKKLQQKLQQNMGLGYHVFAAMNYGQPCLKNVLHEIEKQGIKHLIVLPLFPHYTLATTQSTIEKVKRLTRHRTDIKLQFVEHFYQNEAFINATAERIKTYKPLDYDHVLFSYHSLPIKQIQAVSSESHLEHYDKACHRTTLLLAKALQLQNEYYSTAFQSRFFGRWLGPYTNEVLKQLIRNGKKRVLVVTPSFVADCLETSVEIGIEYRELFARKGGEKFQLVTCLNASDAWVAGVEKIIKSHRLID